MKLNEINGKVNFIMRAGSAFVHNMMPVNKAADLVSNAKQVTKSNLFIGYGINVDDIYFLAGKIEDEPTEKNENVKKN